jgi:hypothetical protein
VAAPGQLVRDRKPENPATDHRRVHRCDGTRPSPTRRRGPSFGWQAAKPVAGCTAGVAAGCSESANSTSRTGEHAQYQPANTRTRTGQLGLTNRPTRPR